MNIKVSRYPAPVFYQQLENFREKNCLSQTDLAREIGITPQRYNVLRNKKYILLRTAKKWSEKIGMKLVDAETFQKGEGREFLLRRIDDLYPTSFLEFITSVEGYGIVVRAFRQYQQDRVDRQLKSKFQSSMKSLEKDKEAGAEYLKVAKMAVNE